MPGARSATSPRFHLPKERTDGRAADLAPNNRRSTLEHLPQGVRPRPGSGSLARPVLLRKEVIQPHLPVRLPCYDLVLITDPTFDGSLHKGWATGFGCYRLS